MTVLPELKIDHIFQIAKSEKDAIAQGSVSGHVPVSKAIHVGQGTSALFHLFPDNYFELIWIHDEKESEHNPLKLHNRFKSCLEKGTCPFGIALRGNLPASELENFFEYKPQYGSFSIFIYKKSMSDFNLPFLFVMNYNIENKSKGLPKRLSPEDQKLIINNGIISFESAVIRSPEISLKTFGNVSFEKSEDFAVEIKSQRNFQLTEIARICIEGKKKARARDLAFLNSCTCF